MSTDIRFEAAYLRAAMLVGLVSEREVPAWAEHRLADDLMHAAQLSELLSAPVEFSAQRDALYPFESAEPDPRVPIALLSMVALTFLANDDAVTEALTVLGSMRREGFLRPPVAFEVKDFEDRVMLAHAGVAGSVAPSAHELREWLERTRTSVFFNLEFKDSDEATSFVAALSRRVFRDRRVWAAEADRALAWLASAENVSCSSVVLLNEAAWLTASREFAPLPIVGRIPHAGESRRAALLMDSETVEPMSAALLRRLGPTS